MQLYFQGRLKLWLKIIQLHICKLEYLELNMTAFWTALPWTLNICSSQLPVMDPLIHPQARNLVFMDN